MNFFSAVKKTFFSKNIINFSSRASRSEYWWSFLIGLPLQIVFQAAGQTTNEYLRFSAMHEGLGEESYITSTHYLVLEIFLLIGLYAAIAMLAVTCRRLHDLNHSGAWIILGFIPLVNVIVGIVFLIMFCQKGTTGQNKYGEDPLL